MKRIVLFAAFAVISVASFAQNKSVVGVWKLASLKSDEATLNIEKPEEMKAELRKQFEASGQPADSAMVEMVFQPLFNSLSTLTFDFGANGKLIMDAKSEDVPQKEEESYTVDYTTGVIISKGKEKEQKIDFKFEGEALVLTVEDQPGKKSILTLKKIK